MAETQHEEDNRQPTLAGCLLMVVSFAVIFGLVIPVLRWRSPASGEPMPNKVAIVVPVLAGAILYAIGSVILELLGLPVLARPKKDSSDRPEDANVHPQGKPPQG